MPKTKFIPRGLSELGFSSIGCTQQYLYEYFSGESRFLKETAKELRAQALSNIKNFTRTRIGWTAPTTEVFANEETKLIKSEAYLWVSEIFAGFSSGDNPYEDTLPVDFNEVFEHLDALPKISGVLSLIRDDLQSEIYRLMEIGLAEKMAGESGSDIASSLNDIKVKLAKIGVLRDYENAWNNLYTLAIRGLGTPIFHKKTEPEPPRDTGIQIV